MNDSQEQVEGHRAALFAGFLGWTLDAFDFFLVVVTLTAIAKEFNRPVEDIALSLALTLGFRPVGAFIFGLLADRYGRRFRRSTGRSARRVAAGQASGCFSPLPQLCEGPAVSSRRTGVLPRRKSKSQPSSAWSTCSRKSRP